MASFLSHVTIKAARNGTTSHTVHPDGTGGTVVDGSAFTPTAGRLLVVCMETSGGVSTTPSGWVLPPHGEADGNSGLYVWYRSSATGTSADQVATTHEFSDFPAIFDFYEFEDGAVFVAAASSTLNGSGVVGPTLAGLTGINWTAGVVGMLNTSTTLSITTTWSAGTEEVDQTVLAGGGIDGYAYSLTYAADNAASSAAFTATSVNQVANGERLVFAVKILGVKSPKIRSVGTHGINATATSSTVPLPPAWEPGDLCYIGWSANGTSFALTVPAGWTEVVPGFNSGGNIMAGVLKRVLQTGDGTSVLITHLNGRLAAVSMAICDHDATKPEDVPPTTDTNGGVTTPSVRASSIDPITEECLLVTFHSARGAVSGEIPTFSPPAGMIEVGEACSQTGSNPNQVIGVAELLLTSASATGTKTGTMSLGVNGMQGSAIVVRSGISEDFMILMTESGYPLLQENRGLLLLES